MVCIMQLLRHDAINSQDLFDWFDWLCWLGRDSVTVTVVMVTANTAPWREWSDFLPSLYIYAPLLCYLLANPPHLTRDFNLKGWNNILTTYCPVLELRNWSTSYIVQPMMRDNLDPAGLQPQILFPKQFLPLSTASYPQIAWPTTSL